MKKSTLVRVAAPSGCVGILSLTTIYLADLDVTAWVSYDRLKDRLLKEAFLELANELISCGGSFEVEFTESDLLKIREFYKIRVYHLLKHASEVGTISTPLSRLVGARTGRLAATSIRNLVSINYAHQRPGILGAPLVLQE